ncbi:unnamed protein product, partial [Rotaria sp. Silwood2]
MTINQTDTTTPDTNGSFEDEDNDVDQIESPYHEPLNQNNYTKACVLYDFN